MKNIQKYFLMLTALLAFTAPLQCMESGESDIEQGYKSGDNNVLDAWRARILRAKDTRGDVTPPTRVNPWDPKNNKDLQALLDRQKKEMFEFVSQNRDQNLISVSKITMNIIGEEIFENPEGTEEDFEKATDELLKVLNKKFVNALLSEQKGVPLSREIKKNKYDGFKIKKELTEIRTSDIGVLLLYHKYELCNPKNIKDADISSDKPKKIWEQGSTYGLLAVGAVAGAFVLLGTQYLLKEEA